MPCIVLGWGLVQKQPTSGTAEGMWIRPEDSITVMSACLREHTLLQIRGRVLAVLLPALSWGALFTPHSTQLSSGVGLNFLL